MKKPLAAWASISLFLTLLLCSSGAYSHARWDLNGSTPPRNTSNGIKQGPCGVDRTSNPAVFEPGETIEVNFESIIYHQGHFRIAFSEANDQGFDDNVLVDDIPDYSGQRYRTTMITLPNVECEDCTLQLIQTMPDKMDGSLYYSCADIALRYDNTGSTSSSSSSTGGSSTSSGSSSTSSSGADTGGILGLKELLALTMLLALGLVGRYRK